MFKNLEDIFMGYADQCFCGGVPPAFLPWKHTQYFMSTWLHPTINLFPFGDLLPFRAMVSLFLWYLQKKCHTTNTTVNCNKTLHSTRARRSMQLLTTDARRQLDIPAVWPREVVHTVVTYVPNAFLFTVLYPQDHHNFF